jgi:hypothetical protein
MDGNDSAHVSPMGGGTPEGNVKPSSAGPIVGTIIIIVIIILGGFYFWSKKVAETPVADEQTQQLQDVSSSDSVADIEADLNATDFTSLDSDIDQIGAESDTSATQTQ